MSPDLAPRMQLVVNTAALHPWPFSGPVSSFSEWDDRAMLRILTARESHMSLPTIEICLLVPPPLGAQG